jgi:hypothetical protein
MPFAHPCNQNPTTIFSSTFAHILFLSKALMKFAALSQKLYFCRAKTPSYDY